MPVARFEDLDLTRQYTYADYLTWTFADRVELLRGWIARMSPAPNRFHQQVQQNLNFALARHLQGQKCKLYPTPFDVSLPRTAGGETVVQPDLCVICDLAKLTEQGCTGAPDLIIEILSPGNSKREVRDKYALYEESGVREYWLVDPLDRHVLRYVLRDGTFVGLAPRTEDDEAIEAQALPGFAVDGADVFRD